MNDKTITYTKDYLAALKAFYSEAIDSARTSKEKIIDRFNMSELQQMARDHTNKKLEEFVTNKNVSERITEFKGDLIQKYHPIYFDPTSTFIKAHFYAPRKMIFGRFVPPYGQM